MESAPPPEPETERPGIAALLNQLAHDTGDFARAEMAWFKAQAGERASYAIPGLVMIGVAIVLGFGAIVALLVGLVLALEPLTGFLLAVLAVIAGAVLIAAVLGKIGAARIKRALKARDER